MSHACTHDEATLGDFVIHDSGCVYYKGVHHVSYINDENRRVFAPILKTLCVSDEIAQCEQLAAIHDAKAVK